MKLDCYPKFLPSPLWSGCTSRCSGYCNLCFCSPYRPTYSGLQNNCATWIRRHPLVGCHQAAELTVVATMKVEATLIPCIVTLWNLDVMKLCPGVFRFLYSRILWFYDSVILRIYDSMIFWFSDMSFCDLYNLFALHSNFHSLMNIYFFHSQPSGIFVNETRLPEERCPLLGGTLK